MTNQQLIDAVAWRTGLSRQEARRAVTAFVAVITKVLRDGGSIRFRGFGTFSTSTRAGRVGVNPRTGSRVVISATSVPKFAAGAQLKRAAGESTATAYGGGGGGAGGVRDSAYASGGGIGGSSGGGFVSAGAYVSAYYARDPGARYYALDVDEMPTGGGGPTRNGDEEPAEQPPQEPPSRTLTRIPHMDLRGSQPLRPGQEFSVVVYADENKPRRGERSKAITVETPPRVRRIELGVWLDTTEHFEPAEDVVLKSLVIDKRYSRSTEAVFALRVKKRLPAHAGTPAIVAWFAAPGGKSAGSVSRNVQLAKVSPHVSRRRKLPAGSLEVDPRARVADVVVHITPPLQETVDTLFYGCMVFSRLHPKYEKGCKGKPWGLPRDTGSFVKEQLAEFTDPSAPDEQRRGRLRGVGKALFDQSPEVFQELYWAIDKRGRKIRTIAIESVEPHVPWELMVPNRGGVEHDPLGVQAAIGRWLKSSKERSRQTIDLRDALVLAPVYSGLDPLRYAKEEAAYVRKTFNGRPVDPATWAGLDACFTAGGANLFHFVGHGERGGRALMLARAKGKGQDGRLSLADLRSWYAASKALAAKQTVVFLNACEAGRQNPSWLGTGSLAQGFTDLGASCVVAPVWSVADDQAYDVAKEFYAGVMAGKPMAAVLQRVRRKAYYSGSDSHGAYCFFGDPRARAMVAAAPSPST